MLPKYHINRFWSEPTGGGREALAWLALRPRGGPPRYCGGGSGICCTGALPAGGGAAGG